MRGLIFICIRVLSKSSFSRIDSSEFCVPSVAVTSVKVVNYLEINKWNLQYDGSSNEFSRALG